MKQLLMGAAATVALLAAGNAFASGNATTIDQVGTSNNAQADQTGSSSGGVIDITQGTGGTSSTDGYNQASATQGGADNVATITQTQGAFGVANPSNQSTSDQQGASGVVTVIQVGNSTSNIVQEGGSSNEHALVGQSNNYNASSIVQAGASELAVVNQEGGQSNQAAIVQSGTGNGVYAPNLFGTNATGPGNLVWHENVPNDSELPGSSASFTEYGPVGAIVDQIGNNNVGGISQAGFQNFADVSQENDSATGGNTDSITQGAGVYYSDAVTYQLGQFNSIALSQEGAGSASSIAFQNGNYNSAAVAQVGSETSSVLQGWKLESGPYPLVADGDNGDGTVNNDLASVTQTSGGDTSTVNQTGDYDQAWVSQTATAGATSTINQAGVGNVAVVRQ